jgi:LPS-assembly protein
MFRVHFCPPFIFARIRLLLILFFSLSISLFGKETIEIFAKNVIAKDNSIFANDSVVILYDGALIKADSAIYDKNSLLLTLKGKVEMIGFEETVLASDRLVINTADNSVKVKKVFLAGEEDLWIDASGADKSGDIYTLFDSRISSCNKADPDWTIEFEKADYYKDKEFIVMESARLRFYDTTVFYLPYFALPTLNKRTTGLLFPNFKVSDREGLLYEQPFFYAPSNSWDMELNPQIRTKRGIGSYLTTRFIDSNHSKGFLRVGYFKNSNDYVRRNRLNKEHWGTELFYQSTDFLSSSRLSEYKSAFYFNGVYLNDREYLNLQKDSASALISSNLVESRLNTFIYDEENYFGLYGRYNIDTSQKDNYNTIQNIPSFHYHHYMEQIAKSNFFYTVDSRLDNYTRVEGSKASQFQVDVPFTYYESFFDDFLNFSMSENLYLSRVDFRNLSLESSENYYYYYRNYHTLKLSSDLSKRYGNSLHNITPSIKYIRPSIENESPALYRELIDEKKELFATQTQEEQLSFDLSQYYHRSDLDMSLFHRFGYTSYPQRVESRGDFNNEMGYNGETISLYSNLTYAWNEKQIRSLISSIGYNQNNYDIMLIHFYNNDFLYDNKKTSFLQSEFAHKYSDKNSWFVNFDYDIEQLYNHQWKFGWSHKQKCWSARVSIGQEVVPNVDNSFRNTSLYLELNLNPIGGIEQNIEEDFSSQGNK